MPDDTEPQTLSRLIIWEPFFERLKELDLLPDPKHTRRVVIDAEVGKLATITYYCFADDRILDALDAVTETKSASESLVK